ncbi:MAG: enoyl-CoA hydratase/isomerase family protein [Planctomycetes bacterium]|nr:enoyl-CoA hydratase/isomerase family protein [Planctomycetota bacterium]
MADHIKLSLEEGIATLVISKPPVNALSSKVFNEIQETLASLHKNPDARAAILTGEGQTFAAGADINEILTITSASVKDMLKRGHEFMAFVENSPLPVIAAVNGACIGGGLELILSCHLRLASDKARFGLPEIGLGIIPGLGGTQRLARLVGFTRAAELILTGDLISAPVAAQWGLVNAVVPEAMLLKQAKGLAKKIAARSKVAVQAALRAIYQGAREEFGKGMGVEAAEFAKLCESADMKEGLKAFIEKRPPKFQDK